MGEEKGQIIGVFIFLLDEIIPLEDNSTRNL